MSITQYVSKIRPHFIKKLNQVTKLTLVAGNSSADLDSITCAINYSFLRFQRDQQWIFPIINIPRNDLTLRRDVFWLLNHVSIKVEDLLFVEDLELIPENIAVDFVLVDHNTPQGQVAEFIKRRNNEIVGIIDHHVDEGHYLNANPRTIEVCGSCSSLVNLYFKDTIKALKLNNESVELLSAAVCADTSGLEFRVEQKDLENVSLFPNATSSFISELTKQLKKAKDDVSGMTISELLRKDYKEFGTSLGKLGISSINTNFEYLYDNYSSTDIQEAINTWMQERDLFKLSIMTSFTNKQGEFCREIAFSPSESGFKNGEVYNALELEPISQFNISGGEMAMYQQQKKSASRKQVAPLLVSYYSAL